MLDVFIYSRSSCRLKSPVVLSGKNFLSTKVTRGARRVKYFLCQVTHSPRYKHCTFFGVWLGGIETSHRVLAQNTIKVLIGYVTKIT